MSTLIQRIDNFLASNEHEGGSVELRAACGLLAECRGRLDEKRQEHDLLYGRNHSGFPRIQKT